MILEQIDSIVMESEINVMNALLDAYVKQQVLMEYAVSTESFDVFQESTLTDKIKNFKISDFVNKIISFIKSMIDRIFTKVKLKKLDGDISVIEGAGRSTNNVTQEAALVNYSKKVQLKVKNGIVQLDYDIDKAYEYLSILIDVLSEICDFDQYTNNMAVRRIHEKYNKVNINDDCKISPRTWELRDAYAKYDKMTNVVGKRIEDLSAKKLEEYETILSSDSGTSTKRSLASTSFNNIRELQAIVNGISKSAPNFLAVLCDSFTQMCSQCNQLTKAIQSGKTPIIESYVQEQRTSTKSSSDSNKVTFEEYVKMINDKKVNKNSVAKIYETYDIDDLPTEIQHMVSLGEEIYFIIDADVRSLTHSEIIHTDTLGVDFKKEKMIPLFDCSDNVFIVYHYDKDKWSKFSITDNTSFKTTDDWRKLIKKKNKVTQESFFHKKTEEDYIQSIEEKSRCSISNDLKAFIKKYNPKYLNYDDGNIKGQLYDILGWKEIYDNYSPKETGSQYIMFAWFGVDEYCVDKIPFNLEDETVCRIYMDLDDGNIYFGNQPWNKKWNKKKVADSLKQFSGYLKDKNDYISKLVEYTQDHDGDIPDAVVKCLAEFGGHNLTPKSFKMPKGLQIDSVYTDKEAYESIANSSKMLYLDGVHICIGEGFPKEDPHVDGYNWWYNIKDMNLYVSPMIHDERVKPSDLKKVCSYNKLNDYIEE